MLKVTAIVTVLAGMLAAGSASGAGEGGQPAVPERKPRAGRTLVFPNAQVKYSLYDNYTRRWVDRPLLVDTSLRDRPDGFGVNLGSFRRTIETVRRYGVDGLSYFPENSATSYAALELSEQAGIPGFSLIPNWGRAGNLEAKGKFLEAALKSKSILRLDGKILIVSYHADSSAPADWAGTLSALRAKYGDTFVFLVDLSHPGGKSWPAWAEQFRAGQGISPADRDAIRADLRAWLDVCDGIHFSGIHGLYTPDRVFDLPFYRDFLIPAYQGVLAEPDYRSKLFGLGAGISHVNCTRIGRGLEEDGTKTLRRSFEAAMAAKPDLIQMMEWDEQNENTSVRPTVDNGWSTQRILAYYMRRIKGEPPAPNAGDDRAIPNLIVSYRKLLALGERLQVEVLNVPDSERAGRLSVSLTLKGPDGKVVRRFPTAVLPADQMRDVTFTLPTEEVPDSAVLVPSLVVRAADGKERSFEAGLLPIQVRATWNWAAKWYHQPLRDLIRPRRADLALVGEPDAKTGTLVAKGAFECDEDLAAVEVMEDDDLIYAVDPRGVYPLSDPDTALLWVELRGLRRTPLHGSITVRGAEATWPGPGPLQLREATGTGNTRRYNGTVSHWVQGRCLALPAASAGAAVIDFAFDALKTSVPVRRVLENGITAETFENGISVSVSRVTKQPDIPAPIGQKSVTFVARVRPETPTAVLHLRAVTRSGRTYRGRPLLVSTTRSGEKTALPVFSDTQRKPVVVKVDPWRVPDIAYEISPTYGAILHTPAGRPFWGNMGAYVDTSTGRGGGEGGNDSLPYFIERGTYPEKATRTAPSLVEEDGTPCLKFDGIGNFVALPAEVIPRRGSYTLSFEIKPLSTEPQVLFIHHGYYIGSVVVSLVDGKLAVSRTNERMHQARAQSELEVPAGKWSQVEVVFDLAAIRLRVNGKKCPPIPSAGPGLYIVPSAFGGWGSADTGEFIGRTGWFEGYLRSLRIRHTVGEG